MEPEGRSLDQERAVNHLSALFEAAWQSWDLSSLPLNVTLTLCPWCIFFSFCLIWFSHSCLLIPFQSGYLSTWLFFFFRVYSTSEGKPHKRPSWNGIGMHIDKILSITITIWTPLVGQFLYWFLKNSEVHTASVPYIITESEHSVPTD